MNYSADLNYSQTMLNYRQMKASIVMRKMTTEPQSVAQIAQSTGLSEDEVSYALSYLMGVGEVHSIVYKQTYHYISNQY